MKLALKSWFDPVDFQFLMSYTLGHLEQGLSIHR
ncbi:rCG53644 [Rattus norvegicus]|uniref:RCG53644 n=1 Tax=Rattus norvegicus TaxID=10116 RepID=A6J880_RAT|nr:rCG53644 [Rattus norvegicus]